MTNDESGALRTNQMLWILDQSLKFVIEAIDTEAIMIRSTMGLVCSSELFFFFLCQT